MIYSQTQALKKILQLKKRLKVIQGGSSAGKTIAILLILIDRAQCEKGKVFSVVSETLPHLKKGAIRDFLNIMESHKYYKDKSWNRTDYIYTFETGTKIEFFSADNADKVRGPRREVLFINEANNVSFETYTQLAIRTNEDIYLDYNPVSEFWVHNDIIGKVDCDFIILTYKDNEELPLAIVDEIESRKGRKGWWAVYGEGQLGEVEGRIYTDWQIIDEIPHEARLESRGLDFGYSNDPTVIQDIYKYNGGYIVNERLRQKGMHNDKIASFIKNLDSPQTLVIADSAEPKSIDEIAAYGVNIIGSIKGQGSVKKGIDFVQSQQISLTKRSVNTIKSYRNYLHKTDKNGKILNDPDHAFSDEMDAIRYGMSNFQPNEVEEDNNWEVQETDY
jgi:phage terminase large subunit